MYPNIIIAFNIAPNCMAGKLVIDRSYLDIANDEFAGESTDDKGKDFMDNLMVGDMISMGTKWYSLPKVEELDKMIQSKFKIRKKKRLNMDFADQIYLANVKVTVGK